jgi:hypothetical protein
LYESEQITLIQRIFQMDLCPKESRRNFGLGLICIYAGTVTISRHRSASPPLMGYQVQERSGVALCQSDSRQNGRRECAFDNELKGCQHQ